MHSALLFLTLFAAAASSLRLEQGRRGPAAVVAALRAPAPPPPPAADVVQKTLGSTGSVTVMRLKKLPTALYILSTIAEPVFVEAHYQGKEAPMPNIDSWDWESIAARNFTAASLSLHSENLLYYQGFVFQSVLHFSDVNGTTAVNPTNYRSEWPLSHLHWEVPTIINHTAQLNLTTHNHPNGSLSMIITPRPKMGTSSENPHLSYTNGSATFAFALRNMTFGDIKKGRVAFKFAYLNSLAITPTLTLNRFINDERSPRTFQFSSIAVADKGYLAWKPAAYGTVQRDNMNSTLMHTSKVQREALSELKMSLAYSLFTERDHIACFNVSIGTNGDAIYGQRYYEWSMVAGLGKVHNDASLSVAILAVALSTFGTPVLAAIIGGIYVAVTFARRSRRTTSYERIN